MDGAVPGMVCLSYSGRGPDVFPIPVGAPDAFPIPVGAPVVLIQFNSILFV